MKKITKILTISLIVAICFFIMGKESGLFAEIDSYSKLQAIQNDKSVSATERVTKFKNYVNALSLKEIVSITKTIAEKYGDKCDDRGISGMMPLASYIYEEHKVDYTMAISEIGNKERLSAWRWMWIDSDRDMWYSTDSPVYGNLDKLKEYISVLCAIIADKEDNPGVRIKATQRLLRLCVWQLREILEQSPVINEKLENEIALKEIIEAGVPENIASKVKTIIQLMVESIDVNLQVLKDPDQDEQFLVRLIGELGGYHAVDITKQNEIAEALRVAFSKRKIYTERVQVELAEIMVFLQLRDYSILPELELMLKEIKDEVSRFRVKKLIKKIKLEEYKNGLRPLE